MRTSSSIASMATRSVIAFGAGHFQHFRILLRSQHVLRTGKVIVHLLEAIEGLIDRLQIPVGPVEFHEPLLVGDHARIRQLFADLLATIDAGRTVWKVGRSWFKVEEQRVLIKRGVVCDR